MPGIEKKKNISMDIVPPFGCMEAAMRFCVKECVEPLSKVPLQLLVYLQAGLCISSVMVHPGCLKPRSFVHLEKGKAWRGM